MGFLKSLFGNREQPVEHFIVASLNARLLPLDRGEFFGDPLDEYLKDRAIGEVSGGGTMMQPSGEVDFCDLEIKVSDPNLDVLKQIVDELERIGAPKGSTLRNETSGETIPFGTWEGLALYLDGVDLPDEVYSTSDIDFVCAELDRILAESGRYLSFWQGPTETALYMYGISFDTMKAKIADFTATYPLCEKSRVEQVA